MTPLEFFIHITIIKGRLLELLAEALMPYVCIFQWTFMIVDKVIIVIMDIASKT